MMVPHTVRIAALVLGTTAFYGYVGQLVPQKEVQPPQEILIRADLTTADMVTVGRTIMDTKGLCFTCHTIGKSGVLRFPDLDGVDARAQTRVPGLNDVEYFAQSIYAPEAYIVPGFNPGMPVINKPPIGLTDQEILCVIAYLQSLGGTPTVTLQTTHRYLAAAPGAAPAPAAAPAAGAAPAGTPAPGTAPAAGAAPGAQPAPAAAPAPGATPAAPAATPAPGAAPGGAQPPAPPGRGAQLSPGVSTPDATVAQDGGVLRGFVGAVAILRPVAAHQVEARLEGAVAR
jgi:hypothetical protein